MQSALILVAKSFIEIEKVCPIGLGHLSTNARMVVSPLLK